MKKILSLIALGAILSASPVSRCSGCHGSHFEKSALGKSAIVADMNATSIETALKGYQTGTYGGKTRGIMQLQVRDANVSVLVDAIGDIQTANAKEKGKIKILSK